MKNKNELQKALEKQRNWDSGGNCPICGYGRSFKDDDCPHSINDVHFYLQDKVTRAYIKEVVKEYIRDGNA